MRGVFQPADGKSPAGVANVTLAIYADESGGSPLWQETQSIDVDSSGRYTLLLGVTEAKGIPLDVFASGEARWLGMAWEPWAGPAPRRCAETLLIYVPTQERPGLLRAVTR